MKRGIFLALIMFLTAGASFSSEVSNVQTAPVLKSDSIYQLRPKYVIEQTEPVEKQTVQLPENAPDAEIKNSEENVQPKEEGQIKKAVEENVVKPVVSEAKAEQKAEAEMKAINDISAKEKLKQSEEKVEKVINETAVKPVVAEEKSEQKVEIIQIPVTREVSEQQTQLKTEQSEDTAEKDVSAENKNTEESIKKEIPVPETKVEEKVENVLPLKEIPAVQPQEEQKILPAIPAEVQQEEKSAEPDADIKDEQVQNQNTDTKEQKKQTEIQTEDKKPSHANELQTAEPEEKFSESEEYLPVYNTEEIVPDLKNVDMPKLKINPVKIVPLKVDSTGEVDSRIKLLNYKSYDETDKYIKKNLTYTNNASGNTKSKLPLNIKPLNNNVNLSMVNTAKRY
ncbi:MAG: hypothetical protein VZR09_07455 [Candidatus Gastranaerophilaceae bacterium]|nr:hypothetical protein [Candidatus Gastranaerophilaceae bacterium]